MKPLTPQDRKNKKISDAMSAANALVREMNAIYENSVISEFKQMRKSDILALSAVEREILIFKILKALVKDVYDAN